MITDHRELAFEDQVERSLLERGGFVSLSPVAFARSRAFFTEVALAFIEKTQPETWRALQQLHKDTLSDKVVDALEKELDRAGVLSVLRHGFKFYGRTLHMAFFQPETRLNPDAAALYAKNRLGVTRQLRYREGSENSVDILLSVNGLPVVTLELKNPLTGQDVEHAKRQYMRDRDPREKLFAGKRALVHFAVDPNVVFMTTRLAGPDTKFLPFNRGRDGGAGNPDDPRGYRTSYLWEDVLARDSLLDIVRRFMHVETQTIKGTGRTRETLIFPRFHQLEAVRQLVAAARAEGPGYNYLVQHSAGSGKSNSIGWLAHRLSDLHNANDQRVFDSVIVVTDRIVLDRQLQDVIYQFEHAQGVVERIEEGSQQLADALVAGRPIIVTTLQKFPYVLNKISTLPARSYAVIVDEAHSSQTTETTSPMKNILSPRSLEEAAAEADAGQAEPEEWQDNVAYSAAARGQQRNLSFFAFTATPKGKTLEVFGRPGEDGKHKAFHLYSMRQAIEEGFILDVLRGYTTYKTYYKLVMRIEEDPKVQKRKAALALARFMSLHPHDFEAKTEVMVEHFRQYTRRRIGGQAKAMVVTPSRLHAVRYKQALDKYIAEKGYTDIKALVAFSGTVVDPDDKSLEYTEPRMNGIRESQLPAKFATPEYQILVVAEKYLTGFDQPLLHTMYVDKRLKGLHAVQTLSRLNRTHPGKEDTFVLDFKNTPDEIQEAFERYYEATLLDETADPQHLYQLQAELDDMRVYTVAEVDNFCRAFFAPGAARTGLEHPELYRSINPALDRFRALNEGDQEEFRNRLKSFVNLYSFLSQIIPFQDTDLEKRYAYGRFLWRALPRRGTGPPYSFDDDIALKYYRLQKMSEGDIVLAKKGGAAVSGMKDVGTALGDDSEEPLSRIVALVNQKYGTEWTAADQLFIDQIREETLADSNLMESARVNTPANFKFKFDKIFEGKVIDRMDQNQTIFERLMSDPYLKEAITDYLIAAIYRAVRDAGKGA